MYVRFPKGFGVGYFWGQLWDASPVARTPIPITFHPDFLWPLWNEIKMRSRCFPRAHPHPFHQSWSSLKPFSSKLMIVHHTTSAKTNFQLNRNEFYIKNHEVHSSELKFPPQRCDWEHLCAVAGVAMQGTMFKGESYIHKFVIFHFAK